MFEHLYNNMVISYMVICFNIDTGAKIALDNLINSGQYRDISEAICVSLVNHDIIQREAQQNGGLEITRADLLNDRSPFVQGSRGKFAHPYSVESGGIL